MPEINLPTKAGQDEIKTLAGNINANVDDVKADVTAVNTNVNSVNTNVNTIKSNVGSNSDASSATGSVHGKIKDVKASVGTTSDAANANGSLHAKVKDIKDNLASFGTPVANYGRTSSSAGYTLNVTGKGILRQAVVWGDMLAPIKITIDGVLVYSGRSATNILSGLINRNSIFGETSIVAMVNEGFSIGQGYPILKSITSGNDVVGLPYTGSNDSQIAIFDGIPFKNSLKIEVLANYIQYDIQYDLL